MNPVLCQSNEYPGSRRWDVPHDHWFSEKLKYLESGNLDVSLYDDRNTRNTSWFESFGDPNTKNDDLDGFSECCGGADTESRDVPGTRPEDAMSLSGHAVSSDGDAQETKVDGIIDKLTKHSTPAQIRQRKRLCLPLIIFANTQTESIIACPDSGSDDNIISLKTASQFDLPVMDIQDPSPPSFVIANGRTISPIGQVHLKCAFKHGFSTTALFECDFYVFQTLAVPMIMGLEFLHSTETLSKHRYRLIEEWVPTMRALRVCSVNRPKRQLVCRVGHYVGCATADTGSDLDLVSPEFAASRAFNVEDSCVEVEFADGSTGYTTGMIRTDFSIGSVGDVEGFIPRTREMVLDLFVLDNLNTDILVGADTIQHLQAFSSHDDCFIPSLPRLGESDLNIIRYIGAVERGMFRAWKFLKDSLTSSEKKQAGTTEQDHKRKWVQEHEQILQDQLDSRNRPSPRRIPREGLPSSEPSLTSIQDLQGAEILLAMSNDSQEQHRSSMPP